MEKLKKSDVEKLDEALCDIVAESSVCNKCEMIREIDGKVFCWFAMHCISGDHKYFLPTPKPARTES